MTQRANDTVRCILICGNSREDSPTHYIITKSIAEYKGGKWSVPFFSIPHTEQDYLEYNYMI